jgi:hypothetical protein
MYGLNMFALIVFGVLNICAVLLCKCEERRRNSILKILCVVLLILNIVRYGLPLFSGENLKIPVEFSAVAYFIVPVILLLNRKKAMTWAAYSGLLAGFFYYMAMIFAGGTIYGSSSPYNIYISMYCHGVLYLCGIVLVNTRVYNYRDRYKLFAGVLFVAAYAWIIRLWWPQSGRLFIYELLDGACVKLLVPQQLWSIFLPVYYVIMCGLLILSVWLFFRLNKIQYRKQTAIQYTEVVFPSKA